MAQIGVFSGSGRPRCVYVTLAPPHRGAFSLSNHCQTCYDLIIIDSGHAPGVGG